MSRGNSGGFHIEVFSPWPEALCAKPNGLMSIYDIIRRMIAKEARMENEENYSLLHFFLDKLNHLWYNLATIDVIHIYAMIHNVL